MLNPTYLQSDQTRYNYYQRHGKVHALFLTIRTTGTLIICVLTATFTPEEWATVGPGGGSMPWRMRPGGFYAGACGNVLDDLCHFRALTPTFI